MIVVKRNKKWVARFSRLNIFIDRHFYKKIKAGDEIEINLPKGFHEIQIQYGKKNSFFSNLNFYMETERIVFEEDGSTKTFLCGMDMKQKHRITYSQITSNLWLRRE